MYRQGKLTMSTRRLAVGLASLLASAGIWSAPASAEVLSVTHYNYDAAGRVKCVAQRMNPATFSASVDACVQGANGAFGPDRIMQTTYTINGDPQEIRDGVATPLERINRSMTYLAPGQIATVKDAKNNLTTYEYDGFNRLKKTRYPVGTVGANASSTTDYEEWSHDPAGNILTERRRDGQVVQKCYDGLNRVRAINYPGSQPDVTNSYDNHSQIIEARQPGNYAVDCTSTVATGTHVLGYQYDALGRVTSETQPLGVVSYQYDAAGQRIRTDYPSWGGVGFHLVHDYYVGGQPWRVRENGATSGVGVLAAYSYDGLGRLSAFTRGNGGVTAPAWDTLSRLANMEHDAPTGGSTHDLYRTFAYNPASQIIERASYNAAYDWPYATAANDTYVVNGLNQYTSAAGQTVLHDARGNTIQIGSTQYAYDSSNRLTGIVGGAQAVYDPSGRLYQITQGGAVTRFLYDGTRLIAEYNGSNQLQRRYAHGPGVDDPIVWYQGTGISDRRWLYKDERGSVIGVEYGSTFHKNLYDEYGVPAAGNLGRFQYTGQTWLSEFGLYYYKARVYNPHLGRFMQTDPIGYEDGMNWYAYVGNDPMNGVDPTGMCTQEELDAKTCLHAQRYDPTKDGSQTVQSDPATDQSARDNMASLRSRDSEQAGYFVRQDDGTINFGSADDLTVDRKPEALVGTFEVPKNAHAVGHSHPEKGGSIVPGYDSRSRSGDYLAVEGGRANYIYHGGTTVVLEKLRAGIRLA